MGLTIYNSDNEVIWDYSYSMLHDIRQLAYQVHKKKFFNAKTNKWNTDYDYKALMHHSDCDGLYLANCYLKEVDFEKSYLIGNLNELIENLQKLMREISRHPKMKINKQIIEAITELLQGLENEIDNGYGMVKFQ